MNSKGFVPIWLALLAAFVLSAPFGIYVLGKSIKRAKNSERISYSNSVSSYSATPETPIQESTNIPSNTQPPVVEIPRNTVSFSPSPIATPSPKPVEDDSKPPLLLKSLGINLDYYDPQTGKAGDLLFTKNKLQFDVLLTEFGFVIPGNMSSTNSDKTNPQPTFQLPLGTKVRSLVDGVVVDVPKLYSNDYSVMVSVNNKSQWRYETEHVINPLVKPGDKVKAGDVIAEVSPHNSEGNGGLGLVEIGILKGGNPPQHICPFEYLDPSIKADVQQKLLALYKSWEEYKGNTNLHNESAQNIPGCLTTNPIDG